MNAMILAAGRGERLRPITDSVPKALVEVRGEVLVDRHLRMLAEAGAQTVVINLGWLGDQIVEHVGSGEQFGVQVVYSPEYDNILETGGGICRALPMLGSDPFWVVNGDIYTDISLADIPPCTDVDGHLVLINTPAYKEKGDFDLHDNLVRFSASPMLTFSGIACYRSEFFANARDGRFSLAPMLFAAAKAERLAGSLYTGIWDDVGTPERLSRINRD